MELSLIFKLLGAAGLVLITFGVITKNRIHQDIFFITGGLLLEAYSIYLKDVIFIPLQIIFVIAAVYGLETELKKRKSFWPLHFFK